MCPVIIQVKWSLYFKLMQSLGPHHAVLILFLFISYQVVFNFSYFWLADWSDDVRLNNFTDLPANSEERRNRNVYYIGVFTGLTVLMSKSDFIVINDILSLKRLFFLLYFNCKNLLLLF